MQEISTIKCYPKALSHEQCVHIINQFELSPYKKQGHVGQGYTPDAKQSTDLGIDAKRDDIVLNNLLDYYHKYCDSYYFMNLIRNEVSIDAGYNIQRYDNGQGYFKWHCEHSRGNSLRVLAWMYYLNDAQCGTEWIHQKFRSKAKEGDLYIWPSSWTHAHRGVTPNIGRKYIITGWCVYA